MQKSELTSVANALRLLEELAAEAEVGVSELARRLGVSKASASRLLGTLRSHDFVEQNPATRRYRLTLKVAVLAEGVRSRLGIVEVARPHLAALARECGEAANLGVLLNRELVYVDTIPSSHLFRIVVRPGTALPAYCTGAGKALLAHLPAAELDDYLAQVELAEYTDTTLTSDAELRAEAEQIRRQGHAVDRGELLHEAWCAAAAVLDRDGYPLAAVSVTAPRSHFDADRDRIIANVTATAAAVTRQVGRA